MTNHELYLLIDQIAPFDTQMDFDNSGFLVGNVNDPVRNVLFALDVTDSVLDEALSLNCNLIVSHHPLMFSPRKQITDNDPEGRILLRLIRSNISLVSAHTNLDIARDGMNDALAEICGLSDIEGDGLIRVGNLSSPLTAEAYSHYLSERLHTVVRILGDKDKLISRPLVCSGAGSSEWESVLPCHADSFISGEIRHHHALALSSNGIVAFECGHYATEIPGLYALADALQSTFNQLQLNVGIFKSELRAYI